MVKSPLLVNSAKIDGDFTINMNKLANYCRRFHHYIDRCKDLRICSICVCGQLGNIWRSRRNFAEENSSLSPSSFSGGFSCIHFINITAHLHYTFCAMLQCQSTMALIQQSWHQHLQIFSETKMILCKIYGEMKIKNKDYSIIKWYNCRLSIFKILRLKYRTKKLT